MTTSDELEAIHGDGRPAEALQARRAEENRLAPNQERLFVLQQLDPGATAYCETVVLRLTGSLRTDVLVAALRALPGRHEWLRSRIEVGSHGPLQVIDDELGAVVVEADLTRGGATANFRGREIGPEARAWVRSLAEEPLRLEEGPPWRAAVGRLAENDHLLVLVVHHVACDATSLAVLIEELGDRYDCALLEEPVELTQPPSPKDLARRIRALQSSEEARRATARHAAALATAALDARVETSVSDPSERPGAAAVCSRPIPSTVARRAFSVAQELGVTPFAILSTAIGATLAAAMSVDTPVLGTPVDLRWHFDDSEEVVSFLVETAAIPLHEVLRRPLVESARAVRDSVAEAMAAPPPFQELVDALRQAGALSSTATPLHTYVTWLDGEESPTLGEHGPAVTHLDLPLGQAKFDLTWTAVGRGEDIELRLEYDSARLDGNAVEQLVSDVVRLLDVATRDPHAPIDGLELLSGEELARLRQWEGQPVEPSDVDLFTLVRDGIATARGPVLIAREESVVGADLLTRVELLGAALRTAGIGRGDRVAVSSSRGPAMIVSLLAVLRAGGTFVPIDISHPPARQAALARTARVSVVVGARDWAGSLAAAIAVRAVAVDATGRPEFPAPPDAELTGLGMIGAERTADDLAYVMFTSGSTGRPRGVRVPDRAVVARVTSYREVLASGGVRYLLQSTLAFDAAIFLFWVLATGGSLVLPTDEESADPHALTRLIARHGVTDAFFVPPLYEAVLRSTQPGTLYSLRRLCIGGDVVPPSVAALHHATVPGATFLDVYGPTEVVVTSTAARVEPEDLATCRALPIGQPHPGTVARVLDPRRRRVPPGAVGELYLGGPCVADGYDPPPGAATGSDAFFMGEDEDGRVQRWYATGDLVRWRDDGRLDFLGRRDRQVKVRGQRVELGEIEAALRRVPGIDDAAVELLGGRDRPRLVAFVAPEVEGVESALASVLPAAWVPDVFVRWPELPRLPSGKLDRGVLRAQAYGRRPPTAVPSAAHGQDGAVGLERAVLATVRAMLDNDSIEVTDDFFEVGGNSLLAARLMGELSAMLGVAVPLHELLGNSTVRGIAELADRDVSRGSTVSRREPALVAVRQQGDLPPAVLVARDGATTLVLQHFLSRISSDRPLWVALRPMPPLGYQAPDLVADGATMAQALLEQFPAGPIHLFGHSASGIVALEAARALGERRGLVILLDTAPPPSWLSQPMHHLTDLARLLVLRKQLRQHDLPAPGEDAPPPSLRIAHEYRRYQDSRAAVNARIRPVDFPITVLTSAATREDRRSGDLGWGRWARRLRLIPLEGDHVSMLLQPDVAETARMLDEVLSRWP
jgi:amino acid adenylation domain-containing protein